VGDWSLRPDPDRPGEFKWMYDKDAPSPGRNPAATTMLPIITSESARAGDVGDWVDPNAPDLTGDEVVDPTDPNYVEPWRGT
jgi:hypothetical protein